MLAFLILHAKPPMREDNKGNSLDLLGWDGALLVLAEHPESLLVPLLCVVVVVHVGQNIAKLLNKRMIGF